MVHILGGIFVGNVLRLRRVKALVDREERLGTMEVVEGWVLVLLVVGSGVCGVAGKGVAGDVGVVVADVVVDGDGLCVGLGVEGGEEGLVDEVLVVEVGGRCGGHQKADMQR